MNVWYVKQLNNTVTDNYVNIILSAMSDRGCQPHQCSNFNNVQIAPDDWAIAVTSPDVLKLRMRAVKNIIFWAQGVWPEESFMRHHNALRRFLTSKMEQMALKYAKKIFVVSEYMLKHYETKYHLDLTGKTYVMPCFNESIHPESFTAEKYSSNTFTYVGSTAVWQCFDETVELYSKIEKKSGNKTKLLLLTGDRDVAEATAQKYNVQNYSIDFVPVSQLAEKLKYVKYGFLLREDHIVNQVATPTKLNTYLANGLIPIYSEGLNGVQEIVDRLGVGIMYQKNTGVNQLWERINTHLDVDSVQRAYGTIFEDFYSSVHHCMNIQHFLLGKLG